MSEPARPPSPANHGLERGLGFKEALALVVGTVIGTGVYLKSGVMAQTLGSPLVVMAAWMVACLLALAGALTYGELGSLFPKAGGEFVYLENAYGKFPAFLYGWMRFWIGAPGAIAAYAVGAATFLSSVIPSMTSVERLATAITFIAIFTGLNCLRVRSSGLVQVVLTVLKVLMISTVIFGVFFFSHGTFTGFATVTEWKGFSAFGTAIIAALWACDGWNNLPMASGEIRDAQRNVPKALVIGMGLILLIYGLTNVSYFFSLSFPEALMANSRLNPTGLPIATLAAAKFMGGGALAFLSIAFIVSALGAMHGSILANGRVPYAMAQDGIFPQIFGRVSASTKVPVIAIVTQSLIACALASFGNYDALTDYVIVWSYVFYFLCGASVFIFRHKMPDAPRSYRVPGYPVVPVVFLLVTAALLVNSFISNPSDALYGLYVLASGVPFYVWKLRSKAKA